MERRAPITSIDAMTNQPREGRDMNQQLTTDVPAASEMDRIGGLTQRVLWPEAGTGKLRAVRRATGVLTVVGTLIQIVVWLLVAVFSRHLDTPWWVFYAVGGAAAITCLWIVDESGMTSPTDEGNHF
jgi:hypothetical protein